MTTTAPIKIARSTTPSKLSIKTRNWTPLGRVLLVSSSAYRNPGRDFYRVGDKLLNNPATHNFAVESVRDSMPNRPALRERLQYLLTNLG
jgi:hypothetical protein